MMLLKSHVRQHLRRTKSGAFVVREHDDSRTKKPRKSTVDMLADVPPALRTKCRRQSRGKGGEISLELREIILLLENGVIGLMSAGRNPENSKDMVLSDIAITNRHESLRADLIRLGFRFIPTKGKYGGEPEDSFMVMIPDIARKDLQFLGEKYNQDSVIYSDHNKNEMIFTTGKNKGLRHEGTGFEVLSDDAKDFYTEIDTPHGKKKFTLSFRPDLIKALFRSMNKI